MDTLYPKSNEIEQDLEKHCYNCASYETGENCTCTAGNHENWTPRKEAETITYNMEVDSGVNTLGGEGRGQHTAPSKSADYWRGYGDALDAVIERLQETSKRYSHDR